MEINFTDMQRNDMRTIPADAAEIVLKNIKVISKLATQSLGESKRAFDSPILQFSILMETN